MKGLELLESYPAAAKLIKEWFYEAMLKSLKDESITEEFRTFMSEQGIDNDKIGILIDANPRMLLDVFDDNQLYISIVATWNTENDEKKLTFIHDINNFKSSDYFENGKYSTRKEAELAAIQKAFEILENKLSPKLEE